MGKCVSRYGAGIAIRVAAHRGEGALPRSNCATFAIDWLRIIEPSTPNGPGARWYFSDVEGAVDSRFTFALATNADLPAYRIESLNDPSGVPEPSAWLLAGGGLAAVAWARRKQAAGPRASRRVAGS